LFLYIMSEESFWEANSESDDESGKITLDELKKQLREYYEPSIIHTYSSALDILASFIKSQAFIYNEASNYCRFRLNMLMFPCIFLSSLCSVFSNVAYNLHDGILYVSCVNAFISFLLAIVNFLKLDANAEAHQISSNHYSKLRTILEFSSGEVLLFSNPLLQLDGVDKEMENWRHIHELQKTNEMNTNEMNTNLYDNYFKHKPKLNTLYEESEQIKLNTLYEEREQIKINMILNLQSKISDIKKRVIEIRESNRFSVPKYIMNRYPVIFNINIFSFIKTVNDYKNACISTLKNIKNEIRYISHNENMNEIQKERIKILYIEKLDIMKELFALSSTYNLIDIMFQQEIKNNILFKQYFYLFYLQKFINLFNCTNDTRFLPKEYKHPYDCGYYDKKLNKYLLRKILNT